MPSGAAENDIAIREIDRHGAHSGENSHPCSTAGRNARIGFRLEPENEDDEYWQYDGRLLAAQRNQRKSTSHPPCAPGFPKSAEYAAKHEEYRRQVELTGKPVDGLGMERKYEEKRGGRKRGACPLPEPCRQHEHEEGIAGVDENAQEMIRNGVLAKCQIRQFPERQADRAVVCCARDLGDTGKVGCQQVPPPGVLREDKKRVVVAEETAVQDRTEHHERQNRECAADEQKAPSRRHGRPARNCGFRMLHTRIGSSSTFRGATFHWSVAREPAPRAWTKTPQRQRAIATARRGAPVGRANASKARIKSQGRSSADMRGP